MQELEQKKYQRNQKRREYDLLMDMMLQLNDTKMMELKKELSKRTDRDTVSGARHIILCKPNNKSSVTTTPALIMLLTHVTIVCSHCQKDTPGEQDQSPV